MYRPMYLFASLVQSSHFVVCSARRFKLLSCTICSSANARLPKLWVRTPSWVWTFRVCSVLSGRGLFDELTTRPEQSYRQWLVVVCNLETTRIRMPWPSMDRKANLGGSFTTFRTLRGYFHFVVRCTNGCDVTSCYGRMTDTILKSSCIYGIL